MAVSTFQGNGTRTSSSGATSATPNITTTSITPGDIIFAMVGVKNASTHTSSSGWTKIDERASSTSLTCSLWAYKVQNGVAVPALTVSWTGSAANFAQTWSVERLDVDQNLSVSSAIGAVNFNTGSTTPATVSSFNATAANSLAMYCAGSNSNTAFGASTGYTERVDNGSATGSTRNVVGTKALTSLGEAAGAVSSTAGASPWVMWLVEIKEPVFVGDTIGMTNSGDGIQTGGTVNTSSSPLATGYNIDSGTASKLLLRFLNVNVPSGKVLLKARIKLVQTGVAGTGTKWGTLYSDVIGDAPTWATEAINSARASNNSVALTNGGANNPIFYDVTEMLRQIIQLPGWANGNSVRFFTDYTTTPDGLISYYASEGGGSTPPQLFLEWTDYTPPGSGSFTRTEDDDTVSISGFYRRTGGLSIMEEGDAAAASNLPKVKGRVAVPVSANLDLLNGSGDSGYSWAAFANNWSAGQFRNGYDGSGNFYYSGIRIPSVSIPQGATITSATLRLYGGSPASGGTTYGNWFGDAKDNAPIFSSSDLPQNISKTTASVPIAQSATFIASDHDVTAIVQEIVNRPGWVSGNALRFGGDNSATGWSWFYDNSNSIYRPHLLISYSGYTGVSEGSDTSTAIAKLKLRGTASKTEASDTLAATGAAGSSGIHGSASITEAPDTIAPAFAPVLASADFQNGVYFLNGSSTAFSDIGGSYDGITFDSGAIVPGTGLVASSANVNIAFSPGMIALTEGGFAIDFDWTLSSANWGLYIEASSADNLSKPYALVGSYNVAISDGYDYYDDTIPVLSNGAHRHALNFSPTNMALAVDGTASTYSGTIVFPSPLNYVRINLYPGATLRSMRIRPAQSSANIQTLSTTGDLTAPNGSLKIKGASSIAEAADTGTISAKVYLKGSAAISEGADTVNSASKLKIKGTIAATEGADTLSAPAKLKLKASLALSEGSDALTANASSRIRATASISEGADTGGASGKLFLKGSVAIADGADTSTVMAKVRLKGSSSISEAADTSTVTGKVLLKGSASILEGADSLASSALLSFPTNHGTVNTTDDPDTISATAALKLKGSTAQTEASDALASSSKLRLKATIATTEAGDTGTGTGKVRLKASAPITEASDTITAQAHLKLRATLNQSEGADSGNGTAKVRLKGSTSVTEAPDTASASSRLKIRATASIQEGPDSDTALAYLRLKSALTTLEGDDTASSSGKVRIKASAAITEAPDTVMASTSQTVHATANITEAPDTVSTTTKLRLKGTVTGTEGADTSTTVAKLRIKATAAKTEAPDGVTSSAKLKLKGAASISEGNDASTSTGKVFLKAAINATEGSDTITAQARVKVRATLSASEAGDTIASTAKSKVRGTVTKTEANDGVTASAKLRIKSLLAISEGPDTVAASSRLKISGIMAGYEGDDSVEFGAIIFDPLPPHYIGAKGKAAVYMGSRSDDELYLGPNRMWPRG